MVVSSKLHENAAIDLDDLHFSKGRKFSAFTGYSQSKLANILFAKELANRLLRLHNLLPASFVSPG